MLCKQKIVHPKKLGLYVLRYLDKRKTRFVYKYYAVRNHDFRLHIEIAQQCRLA